MPRSKFDLTHFLVNQGKIGHIQCLDRIPVIAGESLDIKINGILRLASLRRPLAFDAKVDMFAFYVPHRHIYTNWEQMLVAGVDETESLATSNTSTTGKIDCLFMKGATTYPNWAWKGYIQIWNEYFRDPRRLRASEISLTHSGLGSPAAFGTPIPIKEVKSYGMPACHLPSLMTTGNEGPYGYDLTNDDDTVDTTGDSFEIHELAKVTARYNSESERAWFGKRYRDVMENQFGMKINVDADQRPTLLARETMSLSGYDVDGTADATLGTYAGKSLADVRFNMRRKLMPEHGTVWLLMVVRFPLMHIDEVHYLEKKANPNYKEFITEPRLWAAEPPVEHSIQEYTQHASPDTFGRYPYGQWYRTHPNRIHERFSIANAESGFPFVSYSHLRDIAANGPYINGIGYDSMFSTLQFAHWSLQSLCVMHRYSNLPGGTSSLFVSQ